MLPLLIAAVLLLSWSAAALKPSSCDPSKYLCSSRCPSPPPGLEPSQSEAVCSQDPNTDTCICWLHNPSSQLHLLFQCEATLNDTLSSITCVPPKHCFPPNPVPTCLIVMRCQCLLFEQRFQTTDSWKRVKGIVHTMKKDDPADQSGQPIEKTQGDVREFNLKHLIFLLGFVIAPLLCWCLLNFFHEGKCRKKPLLEPPEACPMPTSRSSTVDNMNNEEAVESSPRSASVAYSIQMPTAPEEPPDPLLQQQLKCESPPPYCQSLDRNFPIDCGPPPAYDEAVRDTDSTIQQMWQAVFIVQPTATAATQGENT